MPVAASTSESEELARPVGVSAAAFGASLAVDGFSDIDGNTHEAAIGTLDSLGVFAGTECGSGLFCPDRPLKRSEMAVWLTRVVDGADPADTDVSRFDDVASDVWWSAHVERLFDLGVTKGCSTDPVRYCPNRSVTRAQMASFLVRAFGLESAASSDFTDIAGSTHEAAINSLAHAGITAGCSTAGARRYCPATAVTRAQMATFLHRAIIVQQTPITVAPDEREVLLGQEVTSAGAVVASGGTVITVPSGAVSGTAQVEIHAPFGDFGTETGGAVVGVTHDRPIAAPITVSWDVAHLSASQLRTVLLVRWDDEFGDWVPSDADYEVASGVLTAEIDQWSIFSWIADKGKELIDKGKDWIDDKWNELARR